MVSPWSIDADDSRPVVSQVPRCLWADDRNEKNTILKAENAAAKISDPTRFEDLQWRIRYEWHVNITSICSIWCLRLWHQIFYPKTPTQVPTLNAFRARLWALDDLKTAPSISDRSNFATIDYCIGIVPSTKIHWDCLDKSVQLMESEWMDIKLDTLFANRLKTLKVLPARSSGRFRTNFILQFHFNLQFLNYIWHFTEIWEASKAFGHVLVHFPVKTSMKLDSDSEFK